jgi:hypothetical protein
MRLALALVIVLSVAAVAHSQQLKAHSVKSYVLTDPDGTPRYLVQYAEEPNVRKVYHIKTAKPANSSPPQRGEGNRRRAAKKRVYWPTEIM